MRPLERDSKRRDKASGGSTEECGWDQVGVRFILSFLHLANFYSGPPWVPSSEEDRQGASTSEGKCNEHIKNSYATARKNKCTQGLSMVEGHCLRGVVNIGLSEEVA